MLHTPTVIFNPPPLPRWTSTFVFRKSRIVTRKIVEVHSLMYMIHVTFEHQEHDFVEIHSPPTPVRHEHTTINDL